jgi:hypothetical protein
MYFFLIVITSVSICNCNNVHVKNALDWRAEILKNNNKWASQYVSPPFAADPQSLTQLHAGVFIMKKASKNFSIISIVSFFNYNMFDCRLKIHVPFEFGVKPKKSRSPTSLSNIFLPRSNISMFTLIAVLSITDVSRNWEGWLQSAKICLSVPGVNFSTTVFSLSANHQTNI